MTLRAILVLLAALAFAVSPFFVPGFGGYDPTQFPNPIEDPSVQPAGYAFSIWGLIYLWLIAMAGYGVWARRGDPAWDATRVPLLLSLVVGAAWLAVAVASPIWATVLIWVMLGGALWALSRTPDTDLWWLRASIGLYAGWLTAASSVSIGLLAAGWGWPPFGETGWAIAALSIGLAITVAMLRTRASLMYGGAVVWALIAVTVRNGFDLVGIFAAGAAVAVALLTLAALRAARA
ncbi:tryptophan-rich sensory protein [uncultured Jannaschia sp.]|uniref:tryptophan-rich sensory protein n=1 Tax=uncultured Jannaschia sp. TaxID=293347 RepID=UPI00263066DB|nr:tryptophan-rich sensory protein [uncultured Jannaschia sp.]